LLKEAADTQTEKAQKAEPPPDDHPYITSDEAMCGYYSPDRPVDD